MSKQEIEFRVVCAHFGDTTRHSAHKWEKRGKKGKHNAKQSVIDLNHTAEMRPDTNFYQGEAPYRVQTREVTPWQDEEVSDG